MTVDVRSTEDGLTVARLGAYRLVVYPQGGDSRQVLQEVGRPSWFLCDDEEDFPPTLYRKLRRAADTFNKSRQRPANGA